MKSKPKLEFKVRVYAHLGCLIFVPTSLKENKHFVPFGEGTIGSSVFDTRRFLECSKGAIELMRLVPMGTDGCGDLDWWESDDGEDNFSWFGPAVQIMDALSRRVTARTFRIRAYTQIPNDVPEAVVKEMARKRRRRVQHAS